MKKYFSVLAILLTLTSISFANDEMISDCDSIEVPCFPTSLWCESSEIIED